MDVDQVSDFLILTASGSVEFRDFRHPLKGEDIDFADLLDLEGALLEPWGVDLIHTLLDLAEEATKLFGCLLVRE
ncbi:hypothetical protein PG990_011502 [Apiospora arundinis]